MRSTRIERCVQLRSAPSSGESAEPDHPLARTVAKLAETREVVDGLAHACRELVDESHRITGPPLKPKLVLYLDSNEAATREEFPGRIQWTLQCWNRKSRTAYLRRPLGGGRLNARVIRHYRYRDLRHELEDLERRRRVLASALRDLRGVLRGVQLTLSAAHRRANRAVGR